MTSRNSSSRQMEEGELRERNSDQINLMDELHVDDEEFESHNANQSNQQ